jgi:hypothetical protein
MLAKISEIEYRKSAQSRMVADSERLENTDPFQSSEQSPVRSKFMSQMPLGAVPIAEIEFDVFCRHELVPIHMALQHLYGNRPQVTDEICTLTQMINVNDRFICSRCRNRCLRDPVLFVLAD